MPDIGASLREARMRARIDISEIEAQTKIRAKYLRALENEEWDLLPGPDVRQELPAHVRRGAGPRRQAARRRVQAAPRAPQRGRAAADQRRRAGPRAPPPDARAAAVVLRRGDHRRARLRAVPAGLRRRRRARPATTAPPHGRRTTASDRPRGDARRRRRRASRPSRVRLRIDATGPVNVCLKAGDRTLVNGQTLQAGQRTRTFRSRRFRLTLGNNSARLRINGKTRRGARVVGPDRPRDHARARAPAAVGRRAARLRAVSGRR